MNTPSNPSAEGLGNHINQFLGRILDKARLYTKPEEQEIRANYLKRMAALLQERIGLDYLQALHDKDPKLVQKMEELTEKGDQAGIAELIESELPQARAITEKALRHFGQQLLTDLGK